MNLQTGTATEVVAKKQWAFQHFVAGTGIWVVEHFGDRGQMGKPFRKMATPDQILSNLVTFGKI